MAEEFIMDARPEYDFSDDTSDHAKMSREDQLLNDPPKMVHRSTEKICPVDLFPFTEHCENVVLLQRKDIRS